MPETELVVLTGVDKKILPEKRQIKSGGSQAMLLRENPISSKFVQLMGLFVVLLLVTMHVVVRHPPPTDKEPILGVRRPPPTDKEPILRPSEEAGSVGTSFPSASPTSENAADMGTSSPSENASATTAFANENGGCTSKSFPNENAGSMGSACAPMALVMYHDFQCPFSKEAYEFFRENFINKGYVEQGCVSFALRDVTSNSRHQYAFEAAKAARCAGEQGLYWEMATMIYSKQSSLTWFSPSDDVEMLFQDWFSSLSTSLTPNVDSFTTCFEHDFKLRHKIEDPIYTDPIMWELKGTPMFAINEELHKNAPYNDILHEVIHNCLPVL